MSKQKFTAVSEDESALFRESIKGTKPLTVSERYIATGRANKAAIKRQPKPDHSTTVEFGECEYLQEVSADQFLEFAISGVRPKRQKLLRQGRIPIDATIDLHGLTVLQAGTKLARFLDSSVSKNMRCVLVIHGRGSRSPNRKPVLKSHVFHWLQHNTTVIALSSARPCNGGEGAMYVLLKRN